MTRPWDLGADARHSVALMLDSGAFSAWTREQEVDLPAYIDYLHRLAPYLWSYVALDVIPGRFNQPRTREEIAMSAMRSHENLWTMRRAGLRPIPVFHMGEDFSWLVRLVEEGEDYIGISPADDAPRPAQRQWLDDCFMILTNAGGAPYVRTHGFGVMSPKFLRRYPWYTVDSTSWAVASGYGNILVPATHHDGTWDYKSHSVLHISGVTRGGATRSYESLSGTEQDAVRRYLEESVGTTIEDIRYDGTARRCAWIHYFKELARQLVDVRFHRPGGGFLLPSLRDPPAPITHLQVTPIFATLNDKTRSRALCAAGGRHRLLSYFYVRDQPDEAIAEYVETGGVSGESQFVPRTNWGSTAYLSYRARAVIRRVRDAERRITS